jgi:hypothetical protein
MKSTFFIFGLLFSGVSISQESCKAKITELSHKYQLQAQFTCAPENFTFSINDRLGIEIYQTDNPDFMWDEKTNNGAIAENGVYAYTLNCRFDDEVIKLTGDFTLER